MAAEVDRLAPMRRPVGASAFGYQRWTKLLFLHWDADPATVRPLVPLEFELDLFDGRAYIGLVPFEMSEIRPSFSGPIGLDFYELNLRTYVTFRGEPGVYFFSLDASSAMAVLGAKLLFGLPYFTAAMGSSEPHPVCCLSWARGPRPLPAAPAGDVLYTSSRRRGGADFRVHYRVGGELPASKPGTLQFFLLERYFLFVRCGRAVYKAQVAHAPYSVRAVKVLGLSESLLTTAGLPALGAPTVAAYWSPGVDVTAFGPWRITGDRSLGCLVLAAAGAAVACAMMAVRLGR